LRRQAIEPHLVSPSTGLLFKNLSPEEREKAELRLAEISIENARDQEKVALGDYQPDDSLEKLSSRFDTAIAAISARHAAFNPNASPLPGGRSNRFRFFSSGNLNLGVIASSCSSSVVTSPGAAFSSRY
jgi:hypothetical protein